MSDDEVGYCPKCGRPLSAYSRQEGGYCESCEDWFPADIVEERVEENE